MVVEEVAADGWNFQGSRAVGTAQATQGTSCTTLPKVAIQRGVWSFPFQQFQIWVTKGVPFSHLLFPPFPIFFDTWN